MRIIALLTFPVLAGCAGTAPMPVVAPFALPSDNIIVADSTTGQLPLERKAPIYPRDARIHGDEAAFFVAFVLDTTGRAVLPSVTFLGDPPVAFANAVCSYYRDLPFTPARVGGVRVAALVVMPFVFSGRQDRGPPYRRAASA